MPNPKNVKTVRVDPATVPLLGRIWSGYQAPADMLPPAATATQDEISVVVDAGHVGRVRIYYRRIRYRHYRSSHWAWVVNRAEPAPDAELTPQATGALPRG